MSDDTATLAFDEVATASARRTHIEHVLRLVAIRAERQIEIMGDLALRSRRTSRNGGALAANGLRNARSAQGEASRGAQVGALQAAASRFMEINDWIGARVIVFDLYDIAAMAGYRWRERER